MGKICLLISLFSTLFLGSCLEPTSKKIDVEVIKKRIDLHFKNQEFQKTILSCDSVLQIDPTDNWVLEKKGIALSSLNQHEDAILVLTSAILNGSKTTDAYGYRGFSKERQNDSIAAIEDYSHAILLDPSNLKALNNRGDLYRKMHQFELAKEDFLSGLKLDSNNTPILNNLGLMYSNIGEYKTAITYYDRESKIKKTDLLLFNRAAAKYMDKQFEDAILDLTEAIQLNPNNSQFYLSRAYSYYQIRRVELMCQDLTVAIGMKNTDAKIFYDAHCK